jgi:hypothetical protein
VSAEAPLCTDTVVAVTIHDVNDNGPVFTETNYLFSVEEHDVGAVAGTVVSFDADEGLNAAATYSITSGNELGLLSIDADSGVVSAVGDIDREVHGATITLQIKVVDRALGNAECLRRTLDQAKNEGGIAGCAASDPNLNPARTSSAQAVVTLIDINDFAPVVSIDSVLNTASDSILRTEPFRGNSK